MDTVYAEDVVVTVAVPDSDKDSLINKVTEATARAGTDQRTRRTYLFWRA